MTLNRKVLKRVHSPLKSPKRNNTSLRKKALLKQLSGDVQFGAATKANLKVVVRVRPQNRQEENDNARCVVKVVDSHMLVFDPKDEDDEFFFRGVQQRRRDLTRRQHKEQKFVFEHIFDENSTNDDVFVETTKDIVTTILDGYNCSVFAYGATGAGKTFTMLGKPESPGIAFLTVMELYRRIEEIKEEKTCEVGISYIEVYNETVRDLLHPGKPLNVLENGQQVMIPGLTLHKPAGADELLMLLAKGNQNRSQHPTDANAESSRSHAVFQVFVRQHDRTADVKANVAIAKLSMIDLAGSERGTATGFKGARFREGASINKSLLALGNCINALADGQRHIPYRDSKLTRLLKDSLGGNCQSVMIAAVSPASTTFEDTFNTLRYANRAKTIKTTIKKNLLNVDQHVSKYVKIVDDLREEICSLKEKVKKHEQEEEDWQQQRESWASATAEFEKKIAELEEKCASSESSAVKPLVSEEEAELQQQFVEACHERKSVRRELLQLESSEREVELKIHNCNAHLQRMKIIAFASQKLDKSISKCERTKRNLDNKLAQIGKLKQGVELKVAANIQKLQDIQSKLSQWGPSEASQELFEKNDTNLAVREHHQFTEYLSGLVRESFNEQVASEKLVQLLLNTTRQFYIFLYAQNQCTPDMESLFKNVVDSMNESKIAWADQQNASETAAVTSQDDSALNVLDPSHFTKLPLTSKIFISPHVYQDHKKMFRRSSMKPSLSTSQLPELLPRNEESVSEPGTRHPVFSPIPEDISPLPGDSTRLTPPMETNEVPCSPVLSTFSSRSLNMASLEARQLPHITTGLALETQVPPQVSRETNLPLTNRETLSTSPAVEETRSPGVSFSASKGSSTKPYGFVSMVDGCGIQLSRSPYNITSSSFNTTELLQDIQPVECSMNATFAVTPAKLDSTNLLAVNTTVDLPAPSQDIRESSNVLSGTQVHNTTVTLTDVYLDSPVITNGIKVATSNDQYVCASQSSNRLNPESPAGRSDGSEKSSSRRLFQPSTLDSTFSVEDESRVVEKGSSMEGSPLGCAKLDESSPVDVNPRLNVHTAQRSPLKPLDNKKEVPSVTITSKEEEEPILEVPSVCGAASTHQPAVLTRTKSFKGLQRRPIGGSPRKLQVQGKSHTPGKFTSSVRLVSPGKNHVYKSSLAMRRSVSVPSLASQPYNAKLSRPSPGINRKNTTAFGGALQRTASLFKRNNSKGFNQENVPPGTQSVRKDAFSSAAKQYRNVHHKT